MDKKISLRSTFKVARYYDPAQIASMAGQHKNGKTTQPKHWKNASKIVLGVDVSQTISDLSMIHYPVLNKKQILPKLGTDMQDSNKSKPMNAIGIPDIYTPMNSNTSVKNTRRTLPVIENTTESETEPEIDHEWISLQQKAIQQMVFDHVKETIKVKILIANLVFDVPLPVIAQSGTLYHIYKASGMGF